MPVVAVKRASLVISFGFVAAFAVAVARLLDELGLPEALDLLGLVLLGAVRHVHEFVERKVFRRLPPAARQIVGFEEFDLPWYVMLAYGTGIFVAAIEAAGFIAGLVGAITGADELLGLGTLASIFTGSFVLYLLGDWLGARCDRYGVAVLFGIVVLGVIVVRVFDSLVLDAAEFEALYDAEKSGRVLLAMTLTGIGFFSVLATVFGLIGFYRGRDGRMARYLHHLLRKLPRDTQGTIVALAYEEAQKAPGRAAGA